MLPAEVRKIDWEKVFATNPDKTVIRVNTGFVAGLLTIKNGVIVNATPGFYFLVGAPFSTVRSRYTGEGWEFTLVDHA